MRKRSILLLGGALAIIASLVVGPAATAGPERASAGTAVIIHDQEPGILNPFLSEGNGYTVALVMNKILNAGLIYNNKVQIVPELLTARPKILKKEPLKVTATYKPTAKWSDGKPITAADFVATYKTIMNPNWDIVSREGWEDIANIKAKGKTFTVTFKPKRAFYNWEFILGAQILPAHKVVGQDFNKLWSDSIDISSGAFKFGSWQKGTQLTMLRNPAYAAGPKAKLDRIVIRYLAGASQFQALKSGEGEVVEPQPAGPDRRLLQGQGLQGAGWLRIPVGAHRLPAGCEGPPGAEAEVRPPGDHPGHQPGPDPRRPVCQDGPRPVGQGPPGSPEPHLQAVRAPVQDAVREVEVQPEERHRSTEEERVHGRSRQAYRGQLEHLQLPERRQALVRLHDDVG